MPVDQNLISNFDQIEEARTEINEFKKYLTDLIDYFNDIKSKIIEQNF
jgi:hypothetical protein